MNAALALALSATVAAVAPAGRTVTLEQAERAAEAQKPEVRIAQANTAAGVARTEQARAPLLPQVKLEGLYERSTGNREQKPDRTFTVSNSFDTFNWFDAEASATQLLWDFGRTSNQWRAAKARAAGLADTERGVRLQALLDVRAAFFQARADKGLVAVAREALANQERHFAQISGFVEAGTRPEIDVVQARADRANARLLLIRADDAYAVARAELNRAMGTVGDTDYDVADDNFPPIPGEDGALGPLIDEGVRARPELAALDAQIGAQELALRAAKGGYWPSLSFVAGATDAGIQFKQTPTIDNFGQVTLFGGMAWNLFAGFKLTWGVFQGFATRGEVHEAGAVLDGLRAQRDGALHQVWVAVQRSALGVRAAKEALTVADEALASARERLRLAEGRYGAGVGSILELSDAQLGQTTAGAQRVAAGYALAAARADLLLALGRR
jgi:outer membrane protein